MRMDRLFNRAETAAVLACAAFLMVSVHLHAASPIPSEWSFEGLVDGSPIVDTNGVSVYGLWQGVGFSPTNNAATAVAISYPQPAVGYPLPSEDHNIAMEIFGNVSNNFAINTNTTYFSDYTTNVWIDLTASPGHLSFEPEVPADTQLALYVNTNGHLVLRHGWYNADFFTTNDWTELSHAPIASNEFVRITIMMNYITDVEILFSHPPYGTPEIPSMGDNFFQLYLNGDLISDPRGYPEAAGTNGLPTGGTWFLAADSGFTTTSGYNNNYLSALALSGAGIVDDVVVGISEAVFSTNAPPLTPFEQWLVDNSLTSGIDDDDEDGASNWAEYVAGTNPNDDSDFFHIIRTEYYGTSNCLMWVIGTATNLSTDFFVLSTTNITDDTSWTMVVSNIQRSATGTNLWYDTVPPDLPTFYRPGLESPPAP